MSEETPTPQQPISDEARKMAEAFRLKPEPEVEVEPAGSAGDWGARKTWFDRLLESLVKPINTYSRVLRGIAEGVTETGIFIAKGASLALLGTTLMGWTTVEEAKSLLLWSAGTWAAGTLGRKALHGSAEGFWAPVFLILVVLVSKNQLFTG